MQTCGNLTYFLLNILLVMNGRTVYCDHNPPRVGNGPRINFHFNWEPQNALDREARTWDDPDFAAFPNFYSLFKYMQEVSIFDHIAYLVKIGHLPEDQYWCFMLYITYTLRHIPHELFELYYWWGYDFHYNLVNFLFRLYSRDVDCRIAARLTVNLYSHYRTLLAFRNCYELAYWCTVTMFGLVVLGFCWNELIGNYEYWFTNPLSVNVHQHVGGFIYNPKDWEGMHSVPWSTVD